MKSTTYGAYDSKRARRRANPTGGFAAFCSADGCDQSTPDLQSEGSAQRAHRLSAWSAGKRKAGLAQLVEQLICNEKVAGSIPATGTNKINML
jgi:hypothetical protein